MSAKAGLIDIEADDDNNLSVFDDDENEITAAIPSNTDGDAAIAFALSQYPELSWLQDNASSSNPQDVSESIAGAAAADMDPKSRALIESMLMEEAQFFEAAQNNRNESQSRSSSSSKKQQGSKKSAGTKSSSSLSQRKSTSSRTRWTDAEERELLQGIVNFGYGAWSQIAEHIGTKTAKQAGEHAQKLHNQGVRIPGAPTRPQRALTSLKPPISPAASAAAKAASAATKAAEKAVAAVTSSIRKPAQTPSAQVDASDSIFHLDDNVVEINITDDSDDEQLSTPSASKQPLKPTPAVKRTLFDTPSQSKRESNIAELQHKETQGISLISQESKSADTNASAPATSANPVNAPQQLIELSSDDFPPDDVPLQKTSVHTNRSVQRTAFPTSLKNSEQRESLQKPNTASNSHASRATQNLNTGFDVESHDSEDVVRMDTKPKPKINHDKDTIDIKPNGKKKPSLHADHEHQPESSPSRLILPSNDNIDYTIDIDTIKPFEMEFCPEWFSNTVSAKRANKTPDRYMRIRNHIIGLWNRLKPRAVTKANIRPGLKKEGDVNAISRVHEFLQDIGAINVDGVWKRKPGTVGVPKDTVAGERDVMMDLTREFGDDGDYTYHRRRRRVRTANGEWAYEVDGVTVDHDAESAARSERQKRKASHSSDEEDLDNDFEDDDDLNFRGKSRGSSSNDKQHVREKRRRQSFSQHSQNAYDPFKLIPLRRFKQSIDDRNRTALHVKVHSSALVVMDLHAHLARTEVIGLIGGNFDASRRELTIRSVFPCESVSTHMQCEMDPESEMQARIDFGSKGLDVVGWYHSHPTFEPNPSIRDIETQVTYQNLFRREEDGVEPFVGVIVSPYDPKMPALISRFQFLTVSKESSAGNEYRIPYSCIKSIVPSTELPDELFVQLTDLARRYQTHQDLINLDEPLRAQYLDPTTKLRKLANSLETHLVLGVTLDQARAFLDRVMDVVVRELCGRERTEYDIRPGKMTEQDVINEMIARKGKSVRKGDMIAVVIKQDESDDESESSDNLSRNDDVQADDDAHVDFSRNNVVAQVDDVGVDEDNDVAQVDEVAQADDDAQVKHLAEVDQSFDAQMDENDEKNVVYLIERELSPE